MRCVSIRFLLGSTDVQNQSFFMEERLLLQVERVHLDVLHGQTFVPLYSGLKRQICLRLVSLSCCGQLNSIKRFYNGNISLQNLQMWHFVWSRFPCCPVWFRAKIHKVLLNPERWRPVTTISSLQLEIWLFTCENVTERTQFFLKLTMLMCRSQGN